MALKAPLLASQALPTGRLFYQHVDEATRYAPFCIEGDPRLWLAAAEMPYPLQGAGPFEPRDALRAWRLANVSIPDGCELYGWQSGLALFQSGPTPGDLHRWKKVDPVALEPSCSFYTANDIADAGRGVRYPPKVRWDASATEPGTRSVVEQIRSIHPHLQRARLGVLVREWNVHPPGSPLLMQGAVLESGFCVLDLPPRATA